MHTYHTHTLISLPFYNLTPLPFSPFLSHSPLYTHTHTHYSSFTRTTEKHKIWLQKVLKSLLDQAPYNLVEIKPALATLFADYLVGYSHWAIADLDILVGRMSHIITPSLLMNYDIYSSSFGDSYRMYLRGQLTIHRNNATINTLWKHCDHLRHIGERLKEWGIVSGSGSTSRWQWMSSEGCYSKVVADYGQDHTVLIATTQLSAFGSSLANKESLMLGSFVAATMLPTHTQTIRSLPYSYLPPFLL